MTTDLEKFSLLQTRLLDHALACSAVNVGDGEGVPKPMHQYTTAMEIYQAMAPHGMTTPLGEIVEPINSTATTSATHWFVPNFIGPGDVHVPAGMQIFDPVEGDNNTLYEVVGEKWTRGEPIPVRLTSGKYRRGIVMFNGNPPMGLSPAGAIWDSREAAVSDEAEPMKPVKFWFASNDAPTVIDQTTLAFSQNETIAFKARPCGRMTEPTPIPLDLLKGDASDLSGDWFLEPSVCKGKVFTSHDDALASLRPVPAE